MTTQRYTENRRFGPSVEWHSLPVLGEESRRTRQGWQPRDIVFVAGVVGGFWGGVIFALCYVL